MPPRNEALAEPKVLAWARKKSGYDLEVAAQKASVSPRSLEKWEAGEGHPSIKSLRRLAHAYRQSVAVFYLHEPPRDFPPISDYRVAWGEEREQPSPELLAEIEQAHVRREIALELLEEPPTFALRAHLADDPNQVAARLRTALGVTGPEQKAWPNTRAAFNSWRDAVEALGVLVLQMTSVDPNEARGFSIADRPMPVVVANNRDPVGARSFTIIHELTHVALHESGVCDVGGRTVGNIEPFCNHVAGAVLVPTAELLSTPTVETHGAETEWTDDELSRLAQVFRVSREVILRRLLILGRTDDDFYRTKRRQLLAEWDRARKGDDEQRWGPSPATVAVVRAGPSFSRLVLSNYYEGVINSSDVAQYLGVRMKHIPRIEQMIFGAAGG